MPMRISQKATMMISVSKYRTPSAGNETILGSAISAANRGIP
jgi:hypothetical protein